MKRPWSLKTKLTGSMIAIVLLTVALISLTANVVIGRQFKAYLARQQRAQAQSIATNLSLQYDGVQWDMNYMHGIGMYALSEGYIIKVYDAENRALWDAEACDLHSCMNVMGQITARMKSQSPQGQFTSQNIPMTWEGTQVGYVSVNYYGPYFLSEEDAYFLNLLNVVLYSIGGLALLLSAVAGVVWARRLSRPIHSAVLAVEQIAGGQYASLMHEKTGTLELDALTQAVNRLAASILQQENLRKQLTADVAHELRTPLTTLQTHLEAMLMGLWEPTPERLQSNLDEVARVGKIVSDLENLASADSGAMKLRRVPTPLKELAQDAAGSFEAEIQRKGLRVQVTGPDVTAWVDPDRMTQALVNLLSNAVKYTPEGGSVSVELAREKDRAFLRVKDTGVGIAPKDLPLIFERFYRADPSRNRDTGGSGIGLAIVKTIVQAHGGTVTAYSALGEGSCFEVELDAWAGAEESGGDG